jgi:hypothetical protein
VLEKWVMQPSFGWAMSNEIRRPELREIARLPGLYDVRLVIEPPAPKNRCLFGITAAAGCLFGITAAAAFVMVLMVVV